ALVPDRPCAEQMKDLRLDDALVAQGLVAPDHERHLLGVAAVLLEMLREHLVGELHAELPCGTLRHLVRIDAVEVLAGGIRVGIPNRSEEHTSELQSRENLVWRLLLERKHCRT